MGNKLAEVAYKRQKNKSLTFASPQAVKYVSIPFWINDYLEYKL